MSSPHSNSTQTTAMPTAVADRTRRTPGCAIERGLDRERDQRLHVGRRHALSFDEDRHGRRRQVRKHVDRHADSDPTADDQEDDAQGQHEGPVAERPRDDAVNHDDTLRQVSDQCTWPCPGVCGDSAASRTRCAPRETIRSPRVEAADDVHVAAFARPTQPDRTPLEALAPRLHEHDRLAGVVHHGVGGNGARLRRCPCRSGAVTRPAQSPPPPADRPARR